MAETEFKEIPSLLEEMTATWKKINSSKDKTIKANKSDLEVIRKAFIAAANYEDMNERWHKAHRLFINKDSWPDKKRDAIYIKTVKEAVKVMRIVEDDRGKKYHSLKNEEMRGYYLQQYVFSYKGEDGCFYDEQGNSYKSDGDLRRKIVTDIAEKYGIRTPRAASAHLRKYCGLKNLPDFVDHSK